MSDNTSDPPASQTPIRRKNATILVDLEFSSASIHSLFASHDTIAKTIEVLSSNIEGTEKVFLTPQGKTWKDDILKYEIKIPFIEDWMQQWEKERSHAFDIGDLGEELFGGSKAVRQRALFRDAKNLARELIQNGPLIYTRVIYPGMKEYNGPGRMVKRI